MAIVAAVVTERTIRLLVTSEYINPVKNIVAQQCITAEYSLMCCWISVSKMKPMTTDPRINGGIKKLMNIFIVLF